MQADYGSSNCPSENICVVWPPTVHAQHTMLAGHFYLLASNRTATQTRQERPQLLPSGNDSQAHAAAGTLGLCRPELPALVYRRASPWGPRHIDPCYERPVSRAARHRTKLLHRSCRQEVAQSQHICHIPLHPTTVSNLRPM